MIPLERRRSSLPIKGALAVFVLLIFTAFPRIVPMQTAFTQRVNPSNSLQSVTEEQWRRLSQRRIYFGHQSVGRNVLDGLAALQRQHPEIQLRLVSTDDPSSVSGPAFMESNLGQNTGPSSKDQAFLSVTAKGLGTGGIAMYKYCYVDVNANSDIAKMFADYRATITAVRRKDPTLTIVHITSPLTTSEPPFSAFVKKALGRRTYRDLNRKRNEFNEMLRAEYSGKDAIFDLAEAESTHPDGSRVYFQEGSKRIYSLAPEYTNDGGHLNEQGSRAAANRLLITLATLN